MLAKISKKKFVNFSLIFSRTNGRKVLDASCVCVDASDGVQPMSSTPPFFAGWCLRGLVETQGIREQKERYCS